MHANSDPANGSPYSRRSTRRRAAATRASIPSVRDVVYVLFKHKQKAACVAAGVIAVTLAAAAFVSSKYTSEAQLLVRMGRESMPTATIAGGPQAMPMLDRMTEVNSEAQIVRSAGVVNRTVERVGVAELIGEAPSADPIELAGQKARAARLLAARIDVRTEPMSAIVKVSYDAKSPAQARDIVQAYVDSYLDHRAEIYGGGGAGGLFEGLTRESQARLLGIEEQIKKLKDQTGVSDVDAQKTILLARVAALQTSLDVANAQLTSTISRIATLEDQREETPREMTLSSTQHEAMGIVATAEGDLNKLRADLDAKMAVYLPTSPTVLQLKDQIALAEKRLAAIGDTRNPRVVGLNPTWAELDKTLATERTNLDGLDAQVQSLSREMNAAKASQATINAVELQMGQLARERGMLVEQLRKLVEGRDFSSIDTAMGKDRVGSVVASQLATLPTSATSPNRPLLLLFGLLASAVCSAGTAALAEMLDPNVGKPLDLKRLGFRRVVSIPQLSLGETPDADDESAAGQQALRELADRDELTPSPAAPTASRGHLLDRVRQAQSEMMTMRFEERDHDDRLRPRRAAPSGHGARDRDPRSLRAALPADHDDDAGRADGRAADRARPRRRRRAASTARSGGGGRARVLAGDHALHHAGDLPGPRPLQRQGAGADAGDAGRRRGCDCDAGRGRSGRLSVSAAASPPARCPSRSTPTARRCPPRPLPRSLRARRAREGRGEGRCRRGDGCRRARRGRGRPR